MIRIEKTDKGWKWGNVLMGYAPVKETIEKVLDVALKAASALVVDQVKRNIIQKGTLVGAPFAPIAEITKRKKKNQSNRERILIDTGQMIDSLNAVKIGELDYNVGFGNAEAADKAAFHEEGGMTEIDGVAVFVPARPFMSPIVESSRVQAMVLQLVESQMHNIGKVLKL